MGAGLTVNQMVHASGGSTPSHPTNSKMLVLLQGAAAYQGIPEGGI